MEKNGENIFAVLPDLTSTLPDGRIFHFKGGHRLWCAPEFMPRTYIPDDNPVDIVPIENGLIVNQPMEAETGIKKSLKILLHDDNQKITIHHGLTNQGSQPVECAPWAISQLKPGGTAILPLSQEQTGFLPNRPLTFWPYSDLTSEQFQWGNRYLILQARMQSPFKIGFRNPRGWLAYWIDQTLFVKKAQFDPQATYYDFNSSSQCYCNDRFLELETLGPIHSLLPGESISHTETWHLFTDIEFPENDAQIDRLVNQLRLE